MPGTAEIWPSKHGQIIKPVLSNGRRTKLVSSVAEFSCDWLEFTGYLGNISLHGRFTAIDCIMRSSFEFCFQLLPRSKCPLINIFLTRALPNYFHLLCGCMTFLRKLWLKQIRKYLAISMRSPAQDRDRQMIYHSKPGVTFTKTRPSRHWG